MQSLPAKAVRVGIVPLNVASVHFPLSRGETLLLQHQDSHPRLIALLYSPYIQHTPRVRYRYQDIGASRINRCQAGVEAAFRAHGIYSIDW